MDKSIQAKHIDDAEFLSFIAQINKEEDRWAYTWDFPDYAPDVPIKVLLAKCKSLIKRGLLTGCTCGCRGDFEIRNPLVD